MVIGTGNPKIPFFACPINRPFLKTSRQFYP